MTAEASVLSDLERRTAWFIKLRWLAASTVIGAAALAAGLGLSVPAGYILAVGAGLLVYNTLLWLVARLLSVRPVEQDWASVNSFARLIVPRTFVGLGGEAGVARAALFAFVQITVDFVFLAVLIHYCGGIESPFCVFFVFHVVISSILLSRRATYVQTTVGFLLLAFVVFGEYFGFLKHYPPDAFAVPGAYRNLGIVTARLAVLGATLFLASLLCSTIAVDLRERVRSNVSLLRQLEGAYEKLRESERTKSQYMRKVAHELRGPLGTIETALKVLLQGLGGALTDRSRELIARAERRAGELAAVTQDLLLLARAREAGLDKEEAPVALDPLLAEVIEDFRERAERKGVALKAGDRAGGVVLGDAIALRQLAANLIENGIRYTEPGGSVTLHLSSQGERLALEVEDTGIGIAAEDLPRVFSEFYRAANAREYAAEGTGLGLTIVKAIAERHGGTVVVESNLGRGTRFTVTLPGVHDRPVGAPE